jgi:hypothetical protein
LNGMTVVLLVAAAFLVYRYCSEPEIYPPVDRLILLGCMAALGFLIWTVNQPSPAQATATRAVATPRPSPAPRATSSATASAVEAVQGAECHPSYPDFCIPPPPPDLDCDDLSARGFRVLPPDPHRLDGGRNGFGCD